MRLLPLYLLSALALTVIADPVHAANDTYSLGIEGFYDRYQEPIVAVDEQAGYGSLTGNYMRSGEVLFGAVDGRASFGEDHYSSPDGQDSGIPQLEFDGRIRAGAHLPFARGTFSPYVGFGTRYFVDEGKGTFTNLGYAGYDRRITQLYAPIGVTYDHPLQNGWSISPTFEYDPLLYGNVNSRLQNAGGYNIDNTQTSGYGLRGELMFDHKNPGTDITWQIGPFARYWNIHDSNVTSAPDGSQWIEPANNRLQVGLAVRVLW